MNHDYDVDIVALVVSPVHRYDGRPAHRDAAVTVLAAEAVEELADELGVPVPDPVLARRAVLLRGAEVEALRGHTFALDCSEGLVVLRGRAGVRCAALSDGVLREGPAVPRSPVPLDPARAGAVRRQLPIRR